MNLIFALKIILFHAGLFLLGSIPTGFIIGKIVKKTDIRKVGSGNVGATNILRVAGPFWGIFTLLFDAGKGAIAIYLSNLLFPNSNLLPITSGILVITGHIFSVFLKFKGGKGIATSIGVLIALCWKEALIVFVIFIIVVAISRFISLGSLISAITLPFVILLIQGTENIYLLLFSILISAAVIIKHKENIKRLLKGNERKFAFKKSIK